ncbi:hypothetical protein AVEN_46265-1 [Araneus ventricosus]|uniref:Uncharacterized protein n=1 Tax=Araneus ventricosus TaxID=182803 RepID=A0A4Y2RNY5_ARAVE|nr:hypothetical protein AVEN_46265-1 [Araneus ventricosus]
MNHAQMFDCIKFIILEPRSKDFATTPLWCPKLFRGCTTRVISKNRVLPGGRSQFRNWRIMGSNQNLAEDQHCMRALMYVKSVISGQSVYALVGCQHVMLRFVI